MEIPAISGRRHKAGANDKVAKAFAAVALLGISGKQRIERGDNSVVFQILRVKLRQPRAVERGAEIEVVAAGALADQTDLGKIWPRAAVRATGHADDDVVLRKPGRRELLVKRSEQGREIPFALGEGEPAGRQRDARHGVAAQSGTWFAQAILGDQRLDRGAFILADVRDDDVLIRRQAHVTLVD